MLEDFGLQIDLNTAASIATIVALVVGIAALFYTGRQIGLTRKISKGSFLLELEKMSARHEPVSSKLRPTGYWSQTNSGPRSLEEWVALEDYMGFFEHCEVLIAQGSLDLDTFKHLFGYRIHNIIGNEVVVGRKLIDEKEHWQLFISLLRRLKLADAITTFQSRPAVDSQSPPTTLQIEPLSLEDANRTLTAMPQDAVEQFDRLWSEYVSVGQLLRWRGLYCYDPKEMISIARKVADFPALLSSASAERLKGILESAAELPNLSSDELRDQMKELLPSDEAYRKSIFGADPKIATSYLLVRNIAAHRNDTWKHGQTLELAFNVLIELGQGLSTTKLLAEEVAEHSPGSERYERTVRYARRALGGAQFKNWYAEARGSSYEDDQKEYRLEQSRRERNRATHDLIEAFKGLSLSGGRSELATALLPALMEAMNVRDDEELKGPRGAEAIDAAIDAIRDPHFKKVLMHHRKMRR